MKKNKLKVSTKAYNKQEKIDKIIKYLTNYPEGTTPKTIAYTTGINVNTVKSLLPHIPSVMKKGEIRGLYILVDKSPHDEIFNWNLQNAIISCEIPEYGGKRVNKTLGFNLVNFKFEIGAESKKATLRLSTEHSINISSLEVYYLLFVELVKKHCTVALSPEETYVSSIEFNKDFTNLRLDGPNCITMDSLLSQFKLYQKTDRLRLEYKTKIPVGINEIFSLLEKGDHSLEVYTELKQLRKQQEIIIDSHRKGHSLMSSILIKLDKM